MRRRDALEEQKRLERCVSWWKARPYAGKEQARFGEHQAPNGEGLPTNASHASRRGLEQCF